LCVIELLTSGLQASWKVWPVAHAINFRFIPTEQRLLYINSIQICYNVFLSVLGSSKK
jgi:protein Mpv17